MLKLAKYVPGVLAFAAVSWAATPAHAQVQMDAGAKVAVGDTSGSCKTDPTKKCIPADVVVYAPFDLRLGRWTLEGVQRDYDPLQFTVGINPDVTVHAYGLTTRTIITAMVMVTTTTTTTITRATGRTATPPPPAHPKPAARAPRHSGEAAAVAL